MCISWSDRADKEMGSGERDQPTQQPHISSLVVRPSGSDGGDGGRLSDSGDYESGKVHRHPPPYSRSDRPKGDLGHRTRAASSSPARHVNRDHRHGSDLDHSGGAPRGREFSSRREASGRYRDHSPSYVRGGAGARPNGRGLDGPEPGLRPFRSDGMNRNNNPNVRPREGDWFCPDPLCRNLNFARREYCNNCKRHRYAPLVSPPPPPRRDYPISTPPPRGLSGNPLDLSPGYRSPPRRWPRDHPPRHDHHPAWRDREREQERVRYPDDDYLSRRRPPLDWSQADRGRDLFLKPHHERRPMLSPPPPLPPPRGSRWGRDVRDRSRSPPMRGGPLPLPRDYRRDRGRDERRGPARARFGNAY